MHLFLPWTACACLAAKATLLKKQKPIHLSFSAWWPGGRVTATPWSACRGRTQAESIILLLTQQVENEEIVGCLHHHDRHHPLPRERNPRRGLRSQMYAWKADKETKQVCSITLKHKHTMTIHQSIRKTMHSTEHARRRGGRGGGLVERASAIPSSMPGVQALTVTPSTCAWCTGSSVAECSPRVRVQTNRLSVHVRSHCPMVRRSTTLIFREHPTRPAIRLVMRPSNDWTTGACDKYKTTQP